MMKKWLQLALLPALVLGLSALLIMPVSATTEWTGDGDGISWFDVENWDDGLPNGENVVIEDGTVLLEADDSVKRIRLDVDATLTVDGSGSGDADLELSDDLEFLEGDNALSLISASFILTGGGDDIKQKEEDSTATITMVDSYLEADEVAANDEDDQDFFLYMTNSTLVTRDNYKSDKKDGNHTIDLVGSTMDIDDEFEFRNKDNISLSLDDSTILAERLQFRGRGTAVASFLNGSTVTLSERLDVADENNGTVTLNISGGSTIYADDRVRLGKEDGSAIVNISGSSSLTSGDEFDFGSSVDSGVHRVNLSDTAVLAMEKLDISGGITSGTDWIDFQDSATMVVGDLTQDDDIEDAITSNLFTASAGGMVSYNLTDNPGDITVFAIPEDDLLGDLPDINIGSQGKTPLHLLLTEVDASSLLIGDPNLAGSISPLRVKQAGDDQTIIHVSTQALVAGGAIDLTSTSLQVTGFLENGTAFTASSSFNPPSLSALSAVPEPSSLILLGLGSMGLLFRRKR